MYHGNLFALLRHEPLPVFTYAASINPPPAFKPQMYQILGNVAKQIMYQERIPVIQNRGQIQALVFRISKLSGFTAEIPNVGRFAIELTETGNTVVSPDQLEDYKLFVNRLADISLTILSDEYHQFHPDAPYVYREEYYFDKDLIEKCGIVDSKRYYRGVHRFNNQLYFVLNRETQLRSNQNLLVEMFSLKNRFEELYGKGKEIDFYDPPQEFVDYVNSLIRGKTADVIRYPGPSVKKIKEVTWKYRAKDVPPGAPSSSLDYLARTYGITGLDPRQPLVVYQLENTGETRHHIPQVLSLGHDFHDLERRIPRWRRQQVWGIIHPDCKNQLSKIYEVLGKIDSNLRARMPEIYPKFVEISTEALDVTASTLPPIEPTIEFGNKETRLSGQYETSFYHQYSEKKIIFAKPVGTTKVLVFGKEDPDKFSEFFSLLQEEFKRRNGSDLPLEFANLDLARTNYSGYQLLMTVGQSDDDDEEYGRYKRELQNRIDIPHQHLTPNFMNKDSVMALVMQITLKLGGDPWLLPAQKQNTWIAGVHSYLNPASEERMILVNVLDGQGSLVRQFDPVSESHFPQIIEELLKLNSEKKRVLYVCSYDRFGIIPEILNRLRGQDPEVEYSILEVDDQDYVRFFETWIPRKVPRFGTNVVEVSKSNIEALESAPEGIRVKDGDASFFLVTGRTIERNAMKRGCPTPIRITVVENKGESWNNQDTARLLLELCLMGRASGHMTRFPSPLYYLRLYAHYVNNYGLPQDESIRQRIFYV